MGTYGLLALLVSIVVKGSVGPYGRAGFAGV